MSALKVKRDDWTTGEAIEANMKIVVFTHYFAPEIGAPSARIYDMAQQWIQMGHQVDVMTCFPNHPSGKLYPGYKLKKYRVENLDGINVHRHWTYITPNEGFFKKTLGHLSYFPSCLVSGRWWEQKPDIIVGSSPTLFAAAAASTTAFLRRVPFVMDVRDLWPAIFVELGVLKNPWLIKILEGWEKHEYRSATKVVTVTESFTQNLIERGLPVDKVHTIPNGADVSYWKPTPKPKALIEHLNLKNKFVVLYIGAHGISHALGKIVDAADILRDNPNVCFLFVGTGAEKKKVAQKADDLSLTNVRFLGPVGKDEVKDFYALADLCLVPLRDIPLFDTFIPSKMFEMLAMGRPILASVRGESAAILRKSGGAMVVEPEDSAAIAAAILELSADPKRLTKMAKNGRSFVAKEYSRQSLARRYLQLFENAIEIYSGGCP